MTQTNFGEQACQQVLAKLDSYIDDELLAGCDLELAEHFRHCAACAREAGQRRVVRTRLRTAVREVRIPSGLEERIRGRLEDARRPQSSVSHLMSIAALLMVGFGSWVVYRNGTFRLTTVSPESYVATISGEVAVIMRVGLGDHLHCALLRRRSNRSKTAIDNLPAQFKEVLPIVRQRVPGDLPLVSAHECRYHDRKFVHLTFGNNRSLLSLVIARKQDGELLGTGIHTAGAQKFQVAAFESRDYLVYTVSDLPRQANLDILTAVAPALEKFLNRTGA
jgi:anti-sigma factor (TIGR02949 family)